MLSLRSCLIASALVLTGLTAGCDRKPQPMKNMTLETAPSRDTRPIPINRWNTSKFMPHEPRGGPAAPPMKR